ncbi:YggS family pyridoxal phosphate-dependent enzyme [Amaricoccus sp.]|uniref:YggS family pyridoxal phosphate-dependent enzyme n=1 Tax=Amaricoccus sp. TaxID=1872485 RepID=UPI001B6D9BD6|nr:YggS family pyridoxal phosphate-dependent enzyme [Amaricoccus sp.]MBP7241650.1 YggS family pyridoxal phosphate-dependent enzyme [Amaricoccus sp.]
MTLAAIETRIAAACVAAGRPRQAVTLVAVSKEQPEEKVAAVLDSGWRIYGENRVQEAEGRWAARRAALRGLELHLIGPLQTNKLARALDLFDAVHSLDRDSLATRLARAVQARGACPTLFVQVNLAAEPQKAGVRPEDLDAFVDACRRTLDLPIFGLMCIPPVEDEPGPHFARLAELAARLDLAGLSMGMSDDFETAIAHGATHIRVGSAIFGSRQAAG